MRILARRQVDEIGADRALRFYGVALCAASALAFLAWGTSTGPRLQDAGAAICWPFFEDCFRYRNLSAGQITALIAGGGVLSAIGAALFLGTRTCGLAWAALLGANVVRIWIMAQDFTLRLNQHYFLSFAVLVFLFFPGKRNLLRYYLVLVYVWAGILKLDQEWLSGSALYADPLWVPKPLIPASAVYVVVLECVLVWGMLSRNAWVYWLTFFQLCLFHFVSFPVVGYYYPVLMYLLLTIFPLTRLIGGSTTGPPGSPSLLGSLMSGREPRSTVAFVATFSALQLVPVIIPGDAAVTGEGRLFAIHMFDARTVCEGTLVARHHDRSDTLVTIPSLATPRIRCDPATYFSIARRLCWERRSDPTLIDIEYVLRSRRQTAPAWHTVVDVRDFCDRRPGYRTLWPNWWINQRGP